MIKDIDLKELITGFPPISPEVFFVMRDENLKLFAVFDGFKSFIELASLGYDILKKSTIKIVLKKRGRWSDHTRTTTALIDENNRTLLPYQVHM